MIFQNPTEYYKKAVCSCMTSNYEGFSMVLIEAMQYGCVPLFLIHLHLYRI